MGIWHPYKDANILIWRRFGYSFLARLFHTLYPDGIYSDKPRLTQVLSLLTTVRLSYPKWKPQLDNLRETAGLDRKLTGHIRNLHDLCEFYIPTVSSVFTVSCACFIPCIFESRFDIYRCL